MAGQLIKDPQTGQWFELQGQQLVPFGGVNPDMAAQAQQVASETGPLGAFGLNVANAFGAGYLPESIRGTSDQQWQADLAAIREQNPWSSVAGQVASFLPAAVATGGASLPVQLGAAGAMGALGNAQDPLTGALTEGAFAGAGMGAVAAGRNLLRGGLGQVTANAGRMVDRVTEAVAGAMPEGGLVSGIQASAPGVNRRIAKAIETAGAATPEGRVAHGTFLPAELDAMRFPTTPADRAVLSATTDAEFNLANRMKSGEAVRMSDTLGLVGGGLRTTREQQRQWVTEYVKRGLGIEGPKALTFTTLGETFERLGGQYDDFAKRVGNVAIDDKEFLALSNIVDDAALGAESGAKQILEKVAEYTNKNGGVLTAEQWSELRHTLSRKIDTAARGGEHAKATTYADLAETLQEAMMKHMPEGAAGELGALNRQYRLASSLIRNPGVIGGDKLINPVSFITAHGGRRPGNLRKLAAGDNEIMKVMETTAMLQHSPIPDSGTAARLLANPVGTAGKAALGVVGVRALMGD